MARDGLNGKDGAPGLRYLGVHVTGENLRRGRRGHGRRVGVVLRARNDHGAGELGRLATDGQARPRRAGRPLMAVTLDDAKTHLHITDPDAGPRGELHAHPRPRHRHRLSGATGRRPAGRPSRSGRPRRRSSRWPTTGNTAATTAPRMTTPPPSGASSTCSSSAAAIPPWPERCRPAIRRPASARTGTWCCSSRPAPPSPTPRAGSCAPGRRCRPSSWYVRIRPATARDVERALAGTLITHRSYVIHGRYHPGVTLATRMTFEGEVYQVTSVINVDERDREMELIADLQE